MTATTTANPAMIRSAGALYLIIIVTGLSAELVLRGPALAALGVVSSGAVLPGLRLSMLADVVMLLSDIALALVFFTLLRPVSEGIARAAMVFRLMQAALIGVSLTFLTAVPGLLAAGEVALAAQFGALHAAGYDIGLVLFGVNSFLMAWLLCHAGMPRVIPAGIAVSGMVYIAGSLARLVAPALLPVIEPAYAIPMLAETALCLWLLIMGRLSWRPASLPAMPQGLAAART